MTRSEFWTLYWMIVFGISVLYTALPDSRLENFLAFMGICVCGWLQHMIEGWRRNNELR